MKKYIAYVLVALVMCSVLCGCGDNRRNDMESIIESPIIDVETDMNDGIVEDKDGIIEDKDTLSNGDSITGNGTAGTDSSLYTSPSPKVSTKP